MLARSLAISVTPAGSGCAAGWRHPVPSRRVAGARRRDRRRPAWCAHCRRWRSSRRHGRWHSPPAHSRGRPATPDCWRHRLGGSHLTTALAQSPDHRARERDAVAAATRRRSAPRVALSLRARRVHLEPDPAMASARSLDLLGVVSDRERQSGTTLSSSNAARCAVAVPGSNAVFTVRAAHLGEQRVDGNP